LRLSFLSTLALASTSDFLNLTLDFDIHLAFACLREAASAKAGILKFGFAKHTLPASCIK